MEDSRKADPRLTEGEWDELVEHLNDSGRERHQARMREQNKQISVELAGLRFKPKINKKSREMATAFTTQTQCSSQGIQQQQLVLHRLT